MIGTTEAAYLLGISCQRLRQLLKAGRVIDAVKVGRFWQIPLFNGMPKIIEKNRKQKSTWRKQRQQGNSIIHIYKQKLDSDRSSKKKKKGKPNKNAGNSPVIIVRQGKKRKYCHYAMIDGPCRIAYLPNQPLDCGARVWIEVMPDVKVKTQVFTQFSSQKAESIEKTAEELAVGCSPCRRRA